MGAGCSRPIDRRRTTRTARATSRTIDSQNGTASCLARDGSPRGHRRPPIRRNSSAAMTRKSATSSLGVATIICSLTSCGLLNSHEVNAPPTAVREQSAWWEKTTAELLPDLLATYVAASDVHRRQGTSTTYVDLHAYRTMLGGPSYELRLPCPPPDGVLDKMRERLRECDLTRRHMNLGSVTAEKCVDCTPDEATRIWRAAIESATFPREDR